MGDVIHNLPVISDIRRRFPDAVIDWVVEESFMEIPRLHPGVRHVIPMAWRRWRKSLFDSTIRQQIAEFRRELKAETYDVVLDTQGLLKSAAIGLMAHGEHRGYNLQSAREPLAACFYQRRFAVSKQMHAVERNRALAAKALGYELDALPLDYGIAAPMTSTFLIPEKPYAVLLHATSRDDKLWPEKDWIELGKRLAKQGLHCQLPWGNDKEKIRSERLAGAIPQSQIPERLRLTDAAVLLANATVVVGVDTGLTHLAAALGVNVVALYVATAPGLTGVYGERNAINLGSTGERPALEVVWEKVFSFIAPKGVTSIDGNRY